VVEGLGKGIVAEAFRGNAGGDASDVLGDWERDLASGGAKSVDVRIPLKDPMMLRRHLAMIEETCHQIRVRMERGGSKDRSDLIMARGVLRLLHKKLNAYRAPRKE
jgi:hypothetical protein